MKEIRTLVTGAAGFIGYHVCEALLKRGEPVFGIDEMNDYYDSSIKEQRLKRLVEHPIFNFRRGNIGDAIQQGGFGPIDRVIHLAAWAGVRNSTKNPLQYGESNFMEMIRLLEAMCKLGGALEHVKYLVYASSSSVKTVRSVYGATKAAVESLADAYSHLHGLPCTGLRFHTVYGPWGRPDMAIWKFTKAAIEGYPIDLYNRGDMRRDFTYVDDIVQGILLAHDKVAKVGEHRIFDLGGGCENELMHLVALIEENVGKAIERNEMPMQKGDAPSSLADLTAAQDELGYKPKWSLEMGISDFVDWYKKYRKLGGE